MPEEPGDARALDRFWDDLVAGRLDDQDDTLPPATSETVRLFQEMAKHPPAPLSRERVDGDVAADIERAAAEGREVPPMAAHRVTAHPDELFGRNGSHDRGVWKAAIGRRQSRWRLAVVVPLVAALLLLALAGSLVTFGTLRPQGEETEYAHLPARIGTLEFLWESTGGPEPLAMPYGLGVAPNGNIWVSDAVRDQFQILASDGTFLEAWGEDGSGEGQFEFYSNESGFANDYGDVAFDAEGNIFVADTGNFRIQKFAPDRSFLLAWGGEGTGNGQFLTPGSIAVDGDGMVYVADEARDDVQKFDGNGQWLATIGKPGMAKGQLSIPAGVAIDTAGNVWIADYGNDRIQRFSAAGEPLDVWGRSGSRPGELFDPNDVAVDAAGHVYVADEGARRLQAFTADGRFIAHVGLETPDAHVRDARTVAVTEDGNVLVVADQRVVALRLFLPLGSELIP